jgi:hypothetical protein
MSYDNYIANRIVPRGEPVSKVAIGDTFCTIHSQIGKTAWISRLLGIHTHTNFLRTFCRKRSEPPRWNHHNGRTVFDVEIEGIYEFRYFCIDGELPAEYRNWSGFCRLRKTAREIDGFEPLSKPQAFRALAELDDAPLFINSSDRTIRETAIQMLKEG